MEFAVYVTLVLAVCAVVAGVLLKKLGTGDPILKEKERPFSGS